MKLVEYELNRAIRLGEFVTGAPKLFGSNLIRALVTRYGFVQAPTTAAEFNFQTGITFQHGYFKNQVIDRLQIYNNGLFAEAKADDLPGFFGPRLT